MIISFSKDYGSFNFRIDKENVEQDLEKCRRIEKLMSYPEWQDLLELYLMMKEKYDESVMKVKPQEQSFRENAIYSSRLNGHWEAVRAPGRIMDEFNKFRKERKAEIAEQVDEMLGNEILTGAVNE